MEQLTLRDLIGYLEFHNRTEGKSSNTIRWYNHELGKFEQFLVGEGASTLLAEIGEPEVRAYIAYLQQKRKWDDTEHCPTAEEGLSPGGIQNRIRALKAFFNWLHREGYTKTYRLDHLANYRIPSRVADVLTEAEIRRVLAACDTKTDWGARARHPHADARRRAAHQRGDRPAHRRPEPRGRLAEGAGQGQQGAHRPLWRRRAARALGATPTTTGRSRWAPTSTSF